MIIDCIADLHGHYPKLEGGDLLIVAGDLTATHSEREYQFFCMWLNKQKYRKKVFVAGNHDIFLQGWDMNKYGQPIMDPDGYTEYLCDSGTEFECLDIGKDGATIIRRKLKIWGSPWTLTFPGINPRCAAFTGTEEELEAKFKLIPADTDILITHGPPYGILDTVRKYGPFSHEREQCVGSVSLLKRTFEIRPKIHIFGHIHEQYGEYNHIPRIGASEILGITSIKFINCSHVNEDYDPVNKPIRIEL